MEDQARTISPTVAAEIGELGFSPEPAVDDDDGYFYYTPGERALIDQRHERARELAPRHVDVEQGEDGEHTLFLRYAFPEEIDPGHDISISIEVPLLDDAEWEDFAAFETAVASELASIQDEIDDVWHSHGLMKADQDAEAETERAEREPVERARSNLRVEGLSKTEDGSWSWLLIEKGEDGRETSTTFSTDRFGQGVWEWGQEPGQRAGDTELDLARLPNDEARVRECEIFHGIIRKSAWISRWERSHTRFWTIVTSP